MLAWTSALITHWVRCCFLFLPGTLSIVYLVYDVVEGSFMDLFDTWYLSQGHLEAIAYESPGMADDSWPGSLLYSWDTLLSQPPDVVGEWVRSLSLISVLCGVLDILDNTTLYHLVSCTWPNHGTSTCSTHPSSRRKTNPAYGSVQSYTW